jgi:hypothetical protein
VEIKQAAEIEWARKEIFLGQKRIMEKNLDYCNLNKKNQTFELKIEETRIKSIFVIFSKINILRFG